MSPASYRASLKDSGDCRPGRFQGAIGGEWGGRFDHLDEAEIAFLPSSGGVLDMLIPRNTRARGLGSLLSEMAGTDEQLHRLTLEGHETRDEIQQHLAATLA